MGMIRSGCAAIATTLLLVTGCSQQIAGTAVTAAGSAPGSGEGQCTAVTAPLTDIPAKSPREPRLRIPVPAGWERNALMDNQIIRFAIVAKALISRNFAPNAVVTLEMVRGLQDPTTVFEQNRRNLVSMMGASGLRTEDNTTCGFPSETTRYTAPPLGPAPRRPVIMHAVVAQTQTATFLATLTVQTADPTNPDYTRDSQEIIDGFQLKLP